MDLPAYPAPAQAKLTEAPSLDGKGAPTDPAPGHPAGSGAALPAGVQAQMERSFGTDFSAVRVHEGSHAAALGALAYTQGTDIHFAPGQYSPHSRPGQELLGHELAHVVQQAEGRVSTPAQAKGLAVNRDAGLEREADESGARAAAGLPARGAMSSTAGTGHPVTAAAGAAQCKLTATGLAAEADVSTPEKLADAIIAKVATKISYTRLAEWYGAVAVRTKLIEMIRDPGKDHGSFDLASIQGPRNLAKAIEEQFPLPELRAGDVVEDRTGVGYVVEPGREQVLVKWVRRLGDSEDAQTYLDEAPVLTPARELRRSTAKIVRERQRPRAPEHYMATAAMPAFGPMTRSPAKNRSPSDMVSDQDSRMRLSQDPAKARVTPKDLSFVPEAMHMQFTRKDTAGAAHIEQMALIGLQEGFRVTVLVAAGEMEDFEFLVSAEARKNITINLCESPPTRWAEDSGEFHVDGSVRVPNRVLNLGERAPEDAITEGRDQRGFYLHPADRQDSDVKRIGAAVASQSAQKEKVATGVAERAPAIAENRSYIEGGNMLTGTHANGQAFALIGMDALYATRKQILPLRSGAATVEDIQRVTEVVSREIGIAPAFIYFVEQPGEFHLDMKMAVMGPGQVIVNDAFDVFDLQQEWILADYQAKQTTMDESAWKALYPAIDAELAELSIKARRAWAYESRTIANLSRIPNLNIVRVAANFPGTKSLPAMNFLNGEGGRGLDNSPFFVTNGGDPRAEAYIAQMYLAELKTGLQRLYFLDRGYSHESLQDSGGIGCRTKGQGTVVT